MGLTPEAEAAMERSMRKEQEERERQAKQRKNNEQLVEMLAKKFQTPPPHQCDDPRVPALERRVAELERIVGALPSQSHDTYHSDSKIIEPDSPLDGLKFSLMRVDEDHHLIGRKRYIAPRKPKEFTAPQNLDTYPGGLLEYIVQCGRKAGLPRNSTRIVVGERFRSTNSINTNVINKVMEELEEAHGFTAPSAGCKHAPLENLRALINSNNQGSIELPSGKWVLTLGKETCPERRVKNGEIQGIHKEYQFLELAPHKDNK